MPFTACAYSYTGKERDPTSGLDNFGARYYASTMGRFMTPDEPFYSGELDNPAGPKSLFVCSQQSVDER